MRYAELFCQSNFSFLTGASSPEQLVSTAASLGYQALALTDECSVAGVVRAHRQIKEQQLPIKLIVGAFFQYQSTLQLVLLCPDRTAYAELCRIITKARSRAVKGQYLLELWDLKSCRHCLVLWLPSGETATDHHWGEWLQKQVGQRLYLAQQRLLKADDAASQLYLQQLGHSFNLKSCAVGAVLMHDSAQLPLQHVLTAIRLGTTVAAAGLALEANAERSLRPIAKLQPLFSKALLEQSAAIADSCHFNLDSLQYEYPAELVPEGLSAIQYLKQLVAEGCLRRFKTGVPEDIQQLITKELQLIEELHYAYFFLTIADVVRFAQSQQILYQGRGSAANSVVCYCLEITAVDPRQISVLFERFISRERAEPPDIDVDFEHERREEIIQYIYQKYGRQRAALAATVISYRLRSSVRDVGKALGFHPTQLEHFLQQINRRDPHQPWYQQLAAVGFDLQSAMAQQFIQLVNQIRGFPRHLSQHVGGFVISAGPLYELVPVENAAMAERTVIQWDKDDLETLGLLKVDILALGMLTALRKTLQLVATEQQRPLQLADISRMGDDPAVYQMIQHANTVGLFQIESRAQMSMLPRLKPACFYDLVIQIAIVRPGPIQGGMVHPFLRRRSGLEAISYPSLALKEVLGRTMGVPIFQEQVIKLAMVAAGFSGGEADQLRRAMASWKKTGELTQFWPKLQQGMLARGYTEAYAKQIFQQICGFGEYGFPESHSASFALLAYASAWLKYYYPLEFFTCLLNSLPMGFYSASQLVQDATRQQLHILPVCIQHSAWDHQIEHLPACHSPDASQTMTSDRALRLGFRQIKGLNQQRCQHMVAMRPADGFTNLAALSHSGMRKDDLALLASSGALQLLSGHRYQSRWQLQDSLTDLPLFANTEQAAVAQAAAAYRHSKQLELLTEPKSAAPLPHQHKAGDLQLLTEDPEPPPDLDSAAFTLPAPAPIDDLIEDYARLGLSLHQHPMALLRQTGLPHKVKTAAQLNNLNDKTAVQVAGLVTARQSPGTAGGVTFVTLEDETGNVNLLVWRATAIAQKTPFLTARILWVHGMLQREGEVIHVIAGQLQSLDHLLPQLQSASRNFH
ncbi:DNA polymerase III subunit alpha [Rheinheimera riviphila]|uniref:Error-prone DNA polymerase n=1 Tax=Rheinheimera riviphila TaxID=1834037 RepID=A0A437QM86_9GAMM|nr:error-prone DNA polymerase [Rheinheimera riviphila]RVU35607.1 DNA polymerase III subunit alpha [Rheinheimera riviphila]